MIVDWRPDCSPIRDQKSCGSCTAFGTIGAWEVCLRLQNMVDVDLSERDLFFCGGGRCEFGSTMEPILNHALKGVASEECCPYVDYNVSCGSGRCTEWWLTGEKLEQWFSITEVSVMKEALTYGPLVGVMAVHESFLHYQSGVYHSLGEQDPIVGYHCLTVVGFDDEKQAWLLRNSWGTRWGMSGYCWIRYGDSQIDEVMYVVEPSDEKPEPQPEPSPCLFGNAIARFLNWFCKRLGRVGRFYYLNV